jgi:hypothetical protein
VTGKLSDVSSKVLAIVVGRATVHARARWLKVGHQSVATDVPGGCL